MARPRRAQTSADPEVKKLKTEDLHYLAGIWEATIGLKSVNTIGAAAISKTEEWPKAMALKYGGEHREFTSSGGKDFWGWFVPLQIRLDILDALETGGFLRATPALELDKVRAKLTKAVTKDAK
jgi:hypothetical protein